MRRNTNHNDDHAAVQILLPRPSPVLVQGSQPVDAIGPGLGQGDTQDGGRGVGQGAGREPIAERLRDEVDGHRAGAGGKKAAGSWKREGRKKKRRRRAWN